MRLHEWLAN